MPERPGAERRPHRVRGLLGCEPRSPPRPDLWRDVRAMLGGYGAYGQPRIVSGVQYCVSWLGRHVRGVPRRL